MIIAKYFLFFNKMGVPIGILTINGGHLWKVDNDSEEEGGKNEGCCVQGARISDVSEIFVSISI